MYLTINVQEPKKRIYWLSSVGESTEFCSYRNATYLRFLCQLSRTLHDELDDNMIAWSGTEAACMKVRTGHNVTRMCFPWCSYLNCIFFLLSKVPSFIPEGNTHYFVVKDTVSWTIYFRFVVYASHTSEQGLKNCKWAVSTIRQHRMFFGISGLYNGLFLVLLSWIEPALSGNISAGWQRKKKYPR